VAESLIASVVEKFLGDYLGKMGEKLAKGGKLTASEVSLLLVAMTQRDISRIYSRIDEVKADMDRRIDALDKKIDDVKDDLTGQISELKSSVGSEIRELKSSVDSQVSELKSSVSAQIADVKADTTYLKRSLDELRDNVISVLVEKLKKE